MQLIPRGSSAPEMMALAEEAFQGRFLRRKAAARVGSFRQFLERVAILPADLGKSLHGIVEVGIVRGQ